MAGVEDPSTQWLLIVTGSTLRAEELDRPLAYYLQQQVDRAAKRLGMELNTRVLADFRWLNEEALQRRPTISIGGHGVNELTKFWLKDVPFSLVVDQQYCVQMNPDLASGVPQASLWGMDNPTTQISVSVFIDRFLPRFLEATAHYVPDPDFETDESDD